MGLVCAVCAALSVRPSQAPPVCVSVSSADVFVCQCLGVSELFSACSQACLPRSHVCCVPGSPMSPWLWTLSWQGLCGKPVTRACVLKWNCVCGTRTCVSLSCARAELCVYVLCLSAEL